MSRTFVHGRVLDVTDSSRLDHVADSETFDGLILQTNKGPQITSEWQLTKASKNHSLSDTNLGHTASTVGATNRLNVAAPFLVASVVTSLCGLFK